MSDIDWDAVAAEAVDILQRYLRLDTTNPPGNEERAADFLAEILLAEGIPSRQRGAPRRLPPGAPPRRGPPPPKAGPGPGPPHPRSPSAGRGRRGPAPR